LPAAPLASGIHVLLVEDNPINQQIAVELLNGAGIEVEVADGGHQALALLGSEAPDHFQLVLMDLQMPGMDGHATTAAIRANRHYDRLPIIALTAHAMADVRQRCLDEGMQDYLSKPIDPASFFETIARWLPASPVVDAPAARPETPSPGGDPLPALTELDTSLGLHYMGGQVALYRKMLLKFRDAHRGTMAALEDLLQRNAFEEAERLAHTLKSTAGSLGALRIQDAAGAVETWLRQGRNEQDTSLLAGLGEAIGDLLAQLDDWAAEGQTSHRQAQQGLSPEVRRVRDELATLLAAYSGEAPYFFERQRPALGQLLDAPALRRLEMHISSFDFDAAADILRLQDAPQT
jgi:CheY-like chemotaxis protein/HPt (histidine-containing phosphotransfer) domain-containing protein